MPTSADLAQRQIDRFRITVDEQRRSIVQLAADGRDTAKAEAILQTMIDLLHRMEQHRDEIAAHRKAPG